MIDLMKWEAKAKAAKNREVDGVDVASSSADLYDDPTFENSNSYANSFLDEEDKRLFKAHQIVKLDGSAGYRIKFKLKP